jgi:Flp pilus assembly protein TadD
LGETVPNDRTEQAKILKQGKKQMAEGRFSEAIAAFNRLKQMAPLEPRAYFLSGIALVESGHLSAAAAELYEAVRLGPEQPEPVLALGNVLIRLGQKRQATRVLAGFDQKTALNGLSTANVSELMKVYFSLEMTSQALRVADELSAREPNHPRIDFYRGKIYKLMGNLDLAQQAIEQSLVKAPGNPANHFELGKIYEQRGQMASAKKAFFEALKHRQNDPETLYAMASVCLSLNEVDEAIEYLKRAELAAANLPKIYYALGQAYQRKGDSEKRAQYFNLQKAHESNLAQRQKEMREREELTLVTLARERLEQGNAPEALALLQQLVELNPNNWEGHQYLAKIYLSSENWQQAYAQLVRLQEIDSSAFEGNQLMADYWYRRKDYAQALRFAEKAKSVQPGNADLRNLLGNIYLTLGQLEEALEEYNLAVKYAPDRAVFRAALEAAQRLVKR